MMVVIVVLVQLDNIFGNLSVVVSLPSVFVFGGGGEFFAFTFGGIRIQFDSTKNFHSLS